MAEPLAGLKVLDLSRVLAGPWAAQLLADLGAEVIKIEKPGAGDDTRSWGPPFACDATGVQTDVSTYFLAANRGKHSVAVDISVAAGQAIIKRLAADSDIFIENFKLGDLARYGLGFADLHAINPRLIYCSITGFGQTGPNAHRAGYDFIIQGMAGLMSVTGTAESGPVKSGVAVSDITSGLYATIAILAALNHVRTTGQGQHIDIALFDVQLGWLANQNLGYLAAGKTPGLMGNAHPSIVPYQDFPTSDGRVIIAVGNDSQFRKLCAQMNCPERASDDRFIKNAGRVANRHILLPLLAQQFAAHPTAHWIAALEQVGVPCGPIQSVAQAWDSDQAMARKLRRPVVHATLGKIDTAAPPIKYSATPLIEDRAPPLLGADTVAILERCGYDEDTIAQWQRDGVVGS